MVRRLGDGGSANLKLPLAAAGGAPAAHKKFHPLRLAGLEAGPLTNLKLPLAAAGGTPAVHRKFHPERLAGLEAGPLLSSIFED